MTRFLEPDEALLLVVDLQDKLLARIAGCERILAAAEKMVRAAQILEVPIVVTEQYPKGLGGTNQAIRKLFEKEGFRPMEKLAFGCLAEPDVSQRLAEARRSQIVVVGIETHVCIQQTALQLLRHGYEPVVCADAVGSRNEFDHETALSRMRQVGVAVTTVESVIFEMLGRAGTDRFKRMLAILT